MTDAMTFDVVIPAVSAADSLKVSVRSALASPLVGRVVVVVTNNQVRNLAMALAFEDPRVRVLASADTRGASCNAGLDLCSADWVAFLDEGDRFGKNYFENLARMINDDFRLSLVFTRLLNADAGDADDHPLRFRFSQGSRVVDLADAPEMIASSAIGAVFNREALNRSGVGFREDLNWSVDTDFVVRFLLETSGMVGVCADADYLFTENSQVSVANIWERPNMYSHPFELVYLPWAEDARERFGSLPEWLQNMLLFQLCGYVEVDRTPGHMVKEMHKDIREWCAGLILATLEYIDADVIERFNLMPLAVDRRMMFLAHCKQAEPGVVGEQVFEGVKGQRRGILEFSYFWLGKTLPFEQIKVGDRSVSEVEGTWVSQRLFGTEFVRERVLRFMGNDDEVRFVIDGQEYEVGPYRGSMSLIDELDLAKAAEIASGGQGKPEIPLDDVMPSEPIDAPTPGRRFKKAEPEVVEPAPVVADAPVESGFEAASTGVEVAASERMVAQVSEAPAPIVAADDVDAQIEAEIEAAEAAANEAVQKQKPSFAGQVSKVAQNIDHEAAEARRSAEAESYERPVVEQEVMEPAPVEEEQSFMARMRRALKFWR